MKTGFSLCGLKNKAPCRVSVHFTASLYRASTGPEQGLPFERFHTGKNLFSLPGPPVFNYLLLRDGVEFH